MTIEKGYRLLDSCCFDLAFLVPSSALEEALGLYSGGEYLQSHLPRRNHFGNWTTSRKARRCALGPTHAALISSSPPTLAPLFSSSLLSLSTCEKLSWTWQDHAEQSTTGTAVRRLRTFYLSRLMAMDIPVSGGDPTFNHLPLSNQTKLPARVARRWPDDDDICDLMLVCDTVGCTASPGWANESQSIRGEARHV